MSKKSLSPIERRAEELDTIAAVLPMERRDELTDQDVATLRHLVNEGMGQNTLRALASDLALPAGLVARRNRCLPALAGAGRFASQFVAHHLWDPEKRKTEPDHGMPRPLPKACEPKGFCGRSARTPPILSADGLRPGRR